MTPSGGRTSAPSGDDAERLGEMVAAVFARYRPHVAAGTLATMECLRCAGPVIVGGVPGDRAAYVSRVFEHAELTLWDLAVAAFDHEESVHPQAT